MAPKRQPRHATNSLGDRIGGQFARGDRANDPCISASLLFGNEPYPVKKRQITMRLSHAQTKTKPASKSQSVRLVKNSQTGFWEAMTPYCSAGAGYAMEKLRGGLQGEESEVLGYYAQTAVALCNAGVVDISDKNDVASVQAGVATAAACLGLPGVWGECPGKTRVGHANALARSLSMNSLAHDLRKNKMLYFASLLGGSFFARDNPFHSFGPLPVEREKEVYNASVINFKEECNEKKSPLTEKEMLIWASAFQMAAQHFLHHTPSGDTQWRVREYDITKGLTPDIVLAQATALAFSGEIPLSQSEHNKKLFKFWIDASESEHTSHFFDSSEAGTLEYADPDQLATRLESSWHTLLPVRHSNPESTFSLFHSTDELQKHESKALSRSEAFDLCNSTPLIKFSEEPARSYKGDLAIGRATPAHTQDRVSASYPLPERSRFIPERHIEFMRRHVLIPASISVKDREAERHNDYFISYLHDQRYYRYTDGADHAIDNMTLNSVIPKAFIALHVMATFSSSDPTRKKAEQFIRETNSQPLIATLVARSLRDAAQTDTNYVSYRNGKPRHGVEVAKAHKRLVLNAAKAWHDFDHDSSAYALPGGRLDPEVMLKKAKEL